MATQDPEHDGRFMQQKVSVGYAMKPSPPVVEFGEALRKRRIVGHRCPACRKVYVPPKGYCPLCVVETNAAEHGVEVADRGTVVAFTVITPIQYEGQKEKNVYVLASILLDGADTAMGQQRIGEIAPEEARTGLRVEAEWAAKAAPGPVGSTEGIIDHWGPTGEPDVPRAELEDQVQ